jgi:hypothetical protein
MSTAYLSWLLLPVLSGSPAAANSAPHAEARVRDFVGKLIGEACRCYSWTLPYYQVAVSPKLEYTIEQVESYSDSVWMRYSVANTGPKRAFVTPFHLDAPLLSITLLDSSSHKFLVPQFDGSITYGHQDTFVLLGSGDTVRFLTQVSTADRGLEQVKSSDGKPARHPLELTYKIARWVRTYSKLSEEGDTLSRMYAVGGGTVPVKWHDGPAPKDLLGGRLRSKQ